MSPSVGVGLEAGVGVGVGVAVGTGVGVGVAVGTGVGVGVAVGTGVGVAVGAGVGDGVGVAAAPPQATIKVAARASRPRRKFRFKDMSLLTLPPRSASGYI